MLLFLFFVLVCCAVKCDYVSNNYYIIEMPEEEVARDYNTPFKVYWNVPSRQCLSRNVVFNLTKFGIIQNDNDTFEGGRITIMYDPGVFPAIFQSDSGSYRYRNGGVPQQGNLELHLTVFRESLNKSIPNPDFSGVGIIDFESWRPIFRQQFGTLTPYIDLSMNIEKRRHWWWPTSWQKMEATKRFEDAARVFMQTTLSIAKQMRPRAIWGYYAFPYCFNMGTNNLVENCTDQIKGENDKIYWLWAESTALYPSVYSSVSLSTAQLAALVRGRVTEANRVKKPGTLVLPYFWFRYRDGSYMSKEDVTAVMDALKKTNASGLIIWGSSSDVNQVDNCNGLYNYVENTLGPIIKSYIQQINRVYDDPEQNDAENDDDYNDTFTTTDATTTDQTTTLNGNLETTTNNFLKMGVDQDSSVLSNSYSKSTSQNNSTYWDIVQKAIKKETTNLNGNDNSSSIENSSTETTTKENVLVNSLDDFLFTIKSTTYPSNDSEDSEENDNFSEDLASSTVDLDSSRNTNEDFSTVYTTQTSTESLENFIIINDDKKTTR
ncbi:hyaluronidase A [Bicyclus anynana]|uniref:Hyaluronidase n=1 Tax=Bicyclus anynana TaxID=110368 RepID=A0A6J1NYS2_BICAN|nr:hyaluronidase A [Bicyclus anynana]